LSESGLGALAPDLFKGLGEELAACTTLVVVIEDPQEQSVVDFSQLLEVVTARGSRLAAVQ